MWTDSHCHLQDESDVAGVLAQAAEADVVRMVCIGTDLDQSRRALALALASSAEANPVGSGSGLGRRSEGEAPAPGPVRVWASVGLHPHRAGDDLAPLVRYLQDLSEPDRRRVVAIGECGLDYHYEFSPRPAQREAFARQVALAREHGLALVIHTREAWDDTFAVLESEGVPERTVFHCFTGGTEEARRCLNIGAWLSFSGIVTFKNAPEVRAAAALCPLDRLLVETDAPYLTPVPHRGKPNTPHLVPLVGQAVADARRVPVEVVAQATWAAADEVFRFDQ